MSNPRRACYTQTAAQSTPEVVEDLGNIMISGYCALDIDIDPDTGEIERYYRLISRYIKVMRLIEEGRADPEKMAPLLVKAVRDSIVDYDKVWKARNVEWHKWTTDQIPGPGTGDKDEYYNAHRRYESPILEFERLHNVAYCALYILTNIGRPSPKIMAQWIAKAKHHQYRCVDMDVWLIDAYFDQAPAEGATAKAKHLALINDVNIAGGTVKQSAWDALWDVHDPLLRAKKVDLTDIKTIEVLQVPVALPEALATEVKGQIIANFLEHANQIAD
jgi:hypothetical protein